jgi:hypothetical protein
MIRWIVVLGALAVSALCCYLNAGLQVLCRAVFIGTTQLPSHLICIKKKNKRYCFRALKELHGLLTHAFSCKSPVVKSSQQANTTSPGSTQFGDVMLAELCSSVPRSASTAYINPLASMVLVGIEVNW